MRGKFRWTRSWWVGSSGEQGVEQGVGRYWCGRNCRDSTSSNINTEDWLFGHRRPPPRSSFSWQKVLMQNQSQGTSSARRWREGTEEKWKSYCSSSGLALSGHLQIRQCIGHLWQIIRLIRRTRRYTSSSSKVLKCSKITRVALTLKYLLKLIFSLFYYFLLMFSQQLE